MLKAYGWVLTVLVISVSGKRTGKPFATAEKSAHTLPQAHGKPRPARALPLMLPSKATLEGGCSSAAYFGVAYTYSAEQPIKQMRTFSAMSAGPKGAPKPPGMS